MRVNNGLPVVRVPGARCTMGGAAERRPRISTRSCRAGPDSTSRPHPVPGVRRRRRRPGAAAARTAPRSTPGGEGYPVRRADGPRATTSASKRLLQIELLKLQDWVKDTGERLVDRLRGPRRGRQGRHDQAVHGAPQPARRPGGRAGRSRPSASAASGTSSATSQHLPSAGEIVLFDRSWYNRAGVERVMGFCTDEEYRGVHARRRREFEGMLVRLRDPPGQAVVLGVAGRAAHPVRRSGRSTRSGSGSCRPTDLASLDQWDDYTEAKEAMFFYTDTAARAVDGGQEQRQEARPGRGDAPRAEPVRLRRQGRGAGRHAGPAIVGPAASVIEHGERSDRVFPDL